MLLVEDDLLPTQLERILHSDTFRHSEVLRRLLRFLAEKSLSGEADYLKEYTLAVEGLGSLPRMIRATTRPFVFKLEGCGRNSRNTTSWKVRTIR